MHTETLLSLCVSVQPEKREQPTGKGWSVMSSCNVFWNAIVVLYIPASSNDDMSVVLYQLLYLIFHISLSHVFLTKVLKTAWTLQQAQRSSQKWKNVRVRYPRGLWREYRMIWSIRCSYGCFVQKGCVSGKIQKYTSSQICQESMMFTGAPSRSSDLPQMVVLYCPDVMWLQFIS